MKANEMLSNPAPGGGSADDRAGDSRAGGRAGRAGFVAVRDARNRRVRGLCTRNGRFYGVLWTEDGNGHKTVRRFPLLNDDKTPVRNLGEAREALEILRGERRANSLPMPGHKPTFADYAQTYFAKARVQRKRPGTLENEVQAVGRWTAHLGHVRIDRIETPMLASYMDKRLHGGKFGARKFKPAGERTVNLDLLMLRNVLRAAQDDGLIRDLPRVKRLDAPPPPEKRLITPGEFERLIEAARGCSKNGPQFADYLRFLAFSGAREQEALRVKWADVDFTRERVAVGADGLAKNKEARRVEFNPQLGALLREMHGRRAPDSVWLFPSPQRGAQDLRAKSFRESLKMAREAAGLPWVGFHHLRHHFCSVCVMAGIDFMTVAAWLGHKDGGILVGKVYGHLLDEHRSNAARRVTFGLAVVPKESAA